MSILQEPLPVLHTLGLDYVKQKNIHGLKKFQFTASVSGVFVCECICVCESVFLGIFGRMCVFLYVFAYELLCAYV